MFDKRATEIIEDNINMSVPWYLMCSYAYYVQDDPLTTDGFFDGLAKKMLDRWDDIDHRHKSFLTKDMLEAGSFSGSYPTIVEGSIEELRKTTKPDRNIKGSKSGKAKASKTKVGGQKLRQQQRADKRVGRVLPGL